ncbi:MAG: DUF3576 domain-containing protein [Rhodospirillales bacterium]|nr:DUF3576 domain-containing protein [Alphaproteobacteria bacterium]MCB9986630.1 DUF3576 domain-containing protein [Rhodospirillales bacterium]USO06841.1 MAG: DUF3576 domain-containing protein [Rhodospirillales bacterium]
MTLRPLLVVIMMSTFALSACGGLESEPKYPTGADRAQTGDDIYKKPDSVFGKDGFNLLGGKSKNATDVITVNSYLWRAALDTVNFMPLSTVDPFGGVILTDWYASPDKPGERYKLNIFVMGSQLRSDGIKVSMFKQRGGKDVAVDPKDNTEIEDAILTRARELRIAAHDDDQ